MASRILGMGDILSLIEKAEEKADLEEAEEMARKLRQARSSPSRTSGNSSAR